MRIMKLSEKRFFHSLMSFTNYLLKGFIYQSVEENIKILLFYANIGSEKELIQLLNAFNCISKFRQNIVEIEE